MLFIDNFSSVLIFIKKYNLVTSILNLKIRNSFKCIEVNLEVIKHGNALNFYSMVKKKAN